MINKSSLPARRDEKENVKRLQDKRRTKTKMQLHV